MCCGQSARLAFRSSFVKLIACLQEDYVLFQEYRKLLLGIVTRAWADCSLLVKSSRGVELIASGMSGQHRRLASTSSPELQKQDVVLVIYASRSVNNYPGMFAKLCPACCKHGIRPQPRQRKRYLQSKENTTNGRQPSLSIMHVKSQQVMRRLAH